MTRLRQTRGKASTIAAAKKTMAHEPVAAWRQPMAVTTRELSMLAFEIIGAVLVLMSLGAMVSTDTRAILR